MSASLQLLLTCPALGRTIVPLGITQALDAVTATAITAAAVVVTGDHTTPREAIPTADVAGVTTEEGPIPVTHHDHSPLNDNAIGHNPTEGIDPTIKAGLDPQEDAPVINPVLQIANVPGVLRSLPTGSDVEQVGASIPSHKPITDQVAKISQICC